VVVAGVQYSIFQTVGELIDGSENSANRVSGGWSYRK
jgi:hypothetical protein